MQAKGALPRTVNMITGPSRSADIEQTLILGAHGPVRLHIIVVEDGAAEVYSGNYTELVTRMKEGSAVPEKIEVRAAPPGGTPPHHARPHGLYLSPCTSGVMFWRNERTSST